MKLERKGKDNFCISFNIMDRDRKMKCNFEVFGFNFKRLTYLQDILFM